MKSAAAFAIRRRTFLTRSGATVATALVAPGMWGGDPRSQPLVRYPDPALVPVDPSFRRYCQWIAAVERLWTGARFTEGPVWFGDGRYLLFSDLPNDRILRWTEETGEVSVFRQPAHKANGNTRDRQGRLISCEHVSRRVTRTELDGTLTVLMDRFQGQRLERAERCGRTLGRRRLVHRSDLRDSQQLRRQRGPVRTADPRLPF